MRIVFATRDTPSSTLDDSKVAGPHRNQAEAVSRKKTRWAAVGSFLNASALTSNASSETNM
jgi:hypothetical protein